MVKRVLIAWELGGQLGHLARLLPIAGHLHAQGVIVAFAVRHLLQSVELLGTTSWLVLQAPMHERKMRVSNQAVNHADLLLMDGFSDVAGVRARVAGWHGLFSLFRPDVVLSDFSPMSILAAKLAGLPVLPIGHGFEIPPVEQDALPVFQPWQQESQRAAAVNDALVQALGLLAETFGTKVPSSLAEFYPPEKSALCIFEELDHFGPRAGSSVFAGPLWCDVSLDSAPEWSPTSGRKVLCYLKPEASSLDLLFQALAKHSCNVLLLSPGLPDQVASQVRGWGVQVVTRPVAVGELLASADAFVTHGGMGMVAMALQAGKPLLVLPSTAEQMLLARRLVQQNLSLATTRWRSRPAMEEKVANLLEQGPLWERLSVYQKKYQCHTPENSVLRVCELLEH